MHSVVLTLKINNTIFWNLDNLFLNIKFDYNKYTLVCNSIEHNFLLIYKNFNNFIIIFNVVMKPNFWSI